MAKRPTIQNFRKKALKDPAVKAEYDAFVYIPQFTWLVMDEGDLLEMLKTKSEEIDDGKCKRCS